MSDKSQIQETLFDYGVPAPPDPLVESFVNGLSDDQKARLVDIGSDVKETYKEADLFSHPLKKGWMIQYLMMWETALIGRWNYWFMMWASNGNPKTPPPRIDFQPPHDQKVVKHLHEMIGYHSNSGNSNSLESFADWLLWGFNEKDAEFPKGVDEKVSKYWYQKFQLQLLLRYPSDYWGLIASEYMGKGHKQGTGFFPTPIHVCTMMSEMVMDKENWKKQLFESVNDPCVGTGSMLLPASNYSLYLYAQDINPLVIKLLKINGFLYVPWLVKPFPEAWRKREVKQWKAG